MWVLAAEVFLTITRSSLPNTLTDSLSKREIVIVNYTGRFSNYLLSALIHSNILAGGQAAAVAPSLFPQKTGMFSSEGTGDGTAIQTISVPKTIAQCRP